MLNGNDGTAELRDAKWERRNCVAEAHKPSIICVVALDQILSGKSGKS